jgi:hypothetical protein
MKKPVVRSLIRNMLLALLVFLVLTLSVIPNGFAQTTQLKIIAPATVPLLTEFSVDISVVDVADLYAWQIKLYFDPAVLRWLNATYPSGHVFSGRSFVSVDPVNESDAGGTYIWFFASLQGDVQGFTGSGTLCRISFEAKAVGNSALTFSRPLGADGDTWLSKSDLLFDVSFTVTEVSVNAVKGPAFTITSPPNDSEVRSSTVTVTWTVTDESSTIDHNEIRLDGGSWVDIGTNTAETFTGLSDGSHTVDVKATNEVGMSIQKSVSFTVNTGLLFGLGYFEIIAIFAIIIVVIGITLYFLKIRKKASKDA